VFFIDNTTGWAVGGGTDSEIILKSANGGVSWQIQKESYQYQRLQGVCFTDLQNGWTVGENGVILKSTNGGLNWIEYNSPTSNYLREIQFPSEFIGYIVGANGTILKYSESSNQINIITPNGGETLITGATYNIEWSSQNVVDVEIEFSTNSGTTWATIIDSIPSTGIYIWTVPNVITEQGRIKISDITDSNIFDISNSDFVIQSSKTITVVDPNGGENIEGESEYEILWNSNDVEFVSLDYSINNGASWNIIIDSTESSGIYIWTVPNILTNQARIRIADLEIPSVYDISNETFRIDYSTSIKEDNLVNSFNLDQNYPNPFNPSTLISYKIPEFSFVTITIYDILGNEVETIVSEEKHKGVYTVQFEASKIPSGIYYYRMTANNFSETRKMILLK
jgi:hypothetical protein